MLNVKSSEWNYHNEHHIWVNTILSKKKRRKNSNAVKTWKKTRFNRLDPPILIWTTTIMEASVFKLNYDLINFPMEKGQQIIENLNSGMRNKMSTLERKFKKEKKNLPLSSKASSRIWEKEPRRWCRVERIVFLIYGSWYFNGKLRKRCSRNRIIYRRKIAFSTAKERFIESFSSFHRLSSSQWNLYIQENFLPNFSPKTIHNLDSV